jgi:hypothetical protein
MRVEDMILVSRMPRDEWKKRNESAGIGVF